MAGGRPLESLIENEGEDDAMIVHAVVRAFFVETRAANVVCSI